MPPTRREQVELDELLSDIYRGIEALPDGAATATTTSNKSPYARGGYVKVKEYELPASSPLVQKHKQAIAALRQQEQQQQQQQPAQRSTLKRHTSQQDPYNSRQPQPQSLATFITSGGGASVTPDSKRRVRILDPEGSTSPQKRGQRQPEDRVKYVNTNKFIYHQEWNPDDEELSDPDDSRIRQANHSNQPDLADEDDDIDGVTRVEYYHTSWLDRQLGRASRRRGSKELKERQVKEKAMIEELKRNLKNGAITLRQSLRGKKKSDSFDEFQPEQHHRVAPNSGKNKYNKYKQSSVFGSGLATIPRNYSNNYHEYDDRENHSSKAPDSNNFDGYRPSEFDSVYRKVSDDEYDETETNNHGKHKQRSSTLNRKGNSSSTPKQTTGGGSLYSPAASHHQQHSDRYNQHQQQSYSRTLPRNYNQQVNSGNKTAEHQLLKNHYRTTATTSHRPLNATPSTNLAQRQTRPSDSTMRNPNYSQCANPNSTQSLGRVKSPLQYPHNQHLNTVMSSQMSAQQRTGETISSIPSATEVVRSALSRSSSQVSINQLNKTINLLPQSPQPPTTPMSPTQHLRAASPSLSPSPVGSRQSPHYTSKTLGHASPHQQPLYPGMTRVTGTRTLERPAPVQQYQPPQRQQPPQPQSTYANPHTSLIQHRQDQQSRQPTRNVGSIREFNELDSLLRSLSPSAMGTNVHVTPGFSNKPAQAAFGGYGGTYNQPQPSQHQQYRPQQPSTDVYAKVQKNPTVSEQSKAGYLQQHYMANTQPSSTHQPFTIDVTDNKDDENCLNQRAQNLSEFEPPIQLLPTMEDYQNISKLNPVRNNYWYKPNMSRERAISLLKEKPQGTFIVRDSTSFRGSFGLAVKVSKLPKNVLRNPNGDPASELIRHFLIEPTGDGVRLKGYANEPVFSNLANLIYQHSLTELALPCKLVIPRADIEDPKFNQKQKQYYDEFIASKEQAKHNPYERTSPNGGYRRYPGDVLVHNEHRIIFE